jgi:AAA domain
MTDEKQPHIRPFQRTKPLPPPERGALSSDEHRRQLREQSGLVPIAELMKEANDEAWEQRLVEDRAALDAQRRVQEAFYQDDEQPPPPRITTPGTVEHVNAANVTTTNVDWLWYPWLAYGKLSMLDGDPSLGKSTLALSFAALVTNGFRFPMESKPIQAREPANVVLLSAEDSAGDTIVPRLYEAGAAAHRVDILQGIRNNGQRQFIHLPEDVDALTDFILEHEARFVAVDVLAAYIGGRGMNSHADADIRTVLARLSGMAEDTNACILATRHLNKTSSEHNAMYRGGGSIAIIGAARTAFVVAKHPRDDTRRVLACVKNNLAPMPEPIGYSVTRGDTYDTARIQWHQEPCNVTLAELLRPPVQDKPGPEPTARDTAADFLAAFLEDGEQLASNIESLAELQDISRATLYRAKKTLGVKSRTEITDEGKRVWWSLPDHDA